MKHILTAADILSDTDYERVRAEKRAHVLAIKKNRRVAVGPYATFYFENYETMWLQVQEMLRIEKGGEAQMTEELNAYNPLIPQGRELVATVMLEIEDPVRRAELLARIGGVEHKMEVRLGQDTIVGTPESDLDYTSAEGKASSVLFVHFKFSPQQILAFRAPDEQVIVAIAHPNYGHMAILPQVVRHELANDFE